MIHNGNLFVIVDGIIDIRIRVLLGCIEFHFISFRFDRCLCYILLSAQVIIYDLIKGNSVL